METGATQTPTPSAAHGDVASGALEGQAGGCPGGGWWHFHIGKGSGQVPGFPSDSRGHPLACAGYNIRQQDSRGDNGRGVACPFSTQALLCTEPGGLSWGDTWQPHIAGAPSREPQGPVTPSHNPAPSTWPARATEHSAHLAVQPGQHRARGSVHARRVPSGGGRGRCRDEDTPLHSQGHRCRVRGQLTLSHSHGNGQHRACPAEMNHRAALQPVVDTGSPTGAARRPRSVSEARAVPSSSMASAQSPPAATVTAPGSRAPEGHPRLRDLCPSVPCMEPGLLACPSGLPGGDSVPTLPELRLLCLRPEANKGRPSLPSPPQPGSQKGITPEHQRRGHHGPQPRAC